MTGEQRSHVFVHLKPLFILPNSENISSPVHLIEAMCRADVKDTLLQGQSIGEGQTLLV